MYTTVAYPSWQLAGTSTAIRASSWQKLEQLFPGSPLAATSPEGAALQKLFEIYSVEAGLFARGSQLIPSDMPLLKDEKFKKNREDFSGRAWTKENIDKNRPEALVMMRKGFMLLEKLVGDGRQWILKTPEPTLADVEGGRIPFRCRMTSLTLFSYLHL